MTDRTETTDLERGGFGVYQDGTKVAGGSGPYERCKAEAAHYAMMYAQDGPVKVRVWRERKRKAHA